MEVPIVPYHSHNDMILSCGFPCRARACVNMYGARCGRCVQVVRTHLPLCRDVCLPHADSRVNYEGKKNSLQ